MLKKIIYSGIRNRIQRTSLIILISFLSQFSVAQTYVIDGIPVFKQQHPFSCNIASIVIVQNYLGYDVDEDGVRRNLKIENRNKGMIPNVFFRYASMSFNQIGYDITKHIIDDQEKVISLIVGSLKSELPVIMYYSTINEMDRPNYDTHYSVIYGIDFSKNEIKISNSYGFLQILTFDELFAGLSYSNYENEPFAHKFGRFSGVIKKQTLFTISPQ